MTILDLAKLDSVESAKLASPVALTAGAKMIKEKSLLDHEFDAMGLEAEWEAEDLISEIELERRANLDPVNNGMGWEEANPARAWELAHSPQGL